MDPAPIDRHFMSALLARRRDGERNTLCSASMAVLSVDGAAVVLMPSRVNREVLCASDERVARVEDVQLTLGEGPAVESFETGGPVLVSDVTTADDRWPMFAASAAGPAGGMFAFPLQIGAIRLGVLDLYRDRPGPLERGDLTAALRVADAVTSVMLASTDGSAADRSLEHLLEQSSSSRGINQAIGMVLVQLEVTAEEAYARLRAFAFAHDRQIRDVAADVVARRLRFEVGDA